MTQSILHRTRSSAVLAGLVLVFAEAHPAAAEETFKALDFRHIGPVGNRVPAVVGVPGDANTYYFGAASGGVWKSSDGGHSWKPIFDDQKVQSIGALAIAPSDANVIWAGTGEAFLRSNISMGNGVYRSTDAGATWTHLGLEKTGRVSRIVVHPLDPDIAWVAALGHCYGPQQDRGVFKTKDGGKTWQKVLFVDGNTGISDLVIDPTNARILWAGAWQIEINTWSRQSGGPGSGLYTSRDGGLTWKKVEKKGLPDFPWGKVALTISAADPKKIYALIETSSNQEFAPFEDFQGVLWRSDDGGVSWKMINADNTLAQRPLYYSRALAAPDDADEVHFMAVQQSRSKDGGVSIAENNSGWDHHDIWIDPTLPNRMIVGHDGGVSISTDRGKSWHKPQLPIAQMYHVEVDDEIPYRVYGNRQDGDAQRGPSRTLDGHEDIPLGAWQTVGGCEVGFTLPDPRDSEIVWAGCYDGILTRYDHRKGIARDVSVWPEAAESVPSKDLKYRFQWTFPMVVSRHDPAFVYVGSQFVHRTGDAGQSWQVVSPDLTGNDPKIQGRSGGLTLDDAGPTLAPTLFALAESRRQAGVLWTGSNDGFVHLSRDGGATWTNLTANLKAVPSGGTISNIEPSRHKDGTVYLTIDRHQLGDFAPYVFKSDDFGTTWKKIVDGLPEGWHSYAHVVREDPRVAGLLYLGTENGLYVSFDDGAGWQSLQGDLPRAPIHWLTIQERFNDLVIATYGRGFWIVDDLGPIQQLKNRELNDAAHLFEPRATWRFRQREGSMRHPDDPAAGSNPREGAALTYYLPHELEAKDKLKLTIWDDRGQQVRELEDLPRKKGLNRVFWNLERDPTKEGKVRTKPLENSKLVLPDRGWREMPDGARLRPLAAPGGYTVKLEVGKTELTTKLTLLADPQSNADDLAAQAQLMARLVSLQDEAAKLVNELEWLRRQLVELRARMAEGFKKEIEDKAENGAKSFDEALQKIEGVFFDLRLTGASQDGLRWPRQIYGKVAQLAWQVGRSDDRPTDSQLEVTSKLESEVRHAREEFEQLISGELATFNRELHELGVGVLPIAWPPIETAAVVED
jgi:photosystem II stability/assembly factor-like uncharacterized protein